MQSKLLDKNHSYQQKWNINTRGDYIVKEDAGINTAKEYTKMQTKKE